MVILTGFADEISHDLEEQLNVLESEGIRHLELRGVWGKNVLDLTEEDAARVKARLDERGFRVSSIGSPLGKIKITDDFAPHYEKARYAVKLAQFFEAPFIRTFSFYIPRGEADTYRDEVMNRMRAITSLGEEAGVIFVHENESHIYGDIGERCQDLLDTIQSSSLKAAFDPANFVQCHVKPMSEAYPLLKDHIAYIHIKDAIMGSGKVVPAGHGDGEVSELIQQLIATGYEGFLSLEPHLHAKDEYEGLSRAELFIVAVRALKKLLKEHDVVWS